MMLNKNIKLIVNYFLGPVVFLFLLFAIYRQVLHQHNWKQSLQLVKNEALGPEQWKLWIICLLMLLNWGLEARKWQLAMRPLQQISYWRAFKATLTGVTMASFTPNRTGEYFGRIMYIDEGKRTMSVSLTILCSFAQLIVTLFAGCAGILYLKSYGSIHPVLNSELLYSWLNVILAFTVFVLLIFLIFYFRMAWLVKFIRSKWIGSKLSAYLKILEDFNATFLVRLLSLSLLRYIVFIIQYYLMFSVFGLSLSPAETFGGMSVVFLVITIVPTFTFLTELGVRWEASIQIMELFGAGTVGILAASFGIWLVNLIIPALIGSLLILGIKLFRIIR
jgi:Lysylphosphatidylglycerol synthase TM region